MYVVYVCEHLRDGREEGAKIFSTIEYALEWINKIANGFCGDNHTFHLFELGKEIPIVRDVVETPQPPKTQNQYTVKKETHLKGLPIEGNQ